MGACPEEARGRSGGLLGQPWRLHSLLGRGGGIQVVFRLVPVASLCNEQGTPSCARSTGDVRVQIRFAGDAHIFCFQGSPLANMRWIQWRMLVYTDSDQKP